MNLFHWFKRAKVPAPCTCHTTRKTGSDCPMHGSIEKVQIGYLLSQLRRTLDKCEEELDRQGM